MKNKYRVEYKFSSISVNYFYYVYEKGLLGIDKCLGVFNTLGQADDFMAKYLEAKGRKYE